MSSSGYHIKVDSTAVRRALRSIPTEAIPYVASTAMTWTAKNIRDAEVATMRSVFDRPTGFTLNALQVIPATKDNLNAAVHFKQGFGSVPADRYLMPEVEGGPRKKKSFERALERAGVLQGNEYVVPGQSAKLDASGNMRGSELSRILSQLNASPDPMQNASSSKRSKRSRRKAGTYFVMRGKQSADGIYKRNASGKVLQQVIRFVGAPSYRARFPFVEVAREIFDLQFVSNARAAWDRLAPKFGK